MTDTPEKLEDSDWVFTAEAWELAYELYKKNGHNVSEVHRLLNGPEHGRVVSRKTLQKWKHKYNWDTWIARAEAAREAMENASSDEGLLNDLILRKQELDDAFAKLPAGEMKSQLLFAYLNIIEKIVDIRSKIRAFDLDKFSLFFRELITFLQENDPEAVETINRNFDSFTAYIRDKYDIA